jgi:hypothetical protein
MQPALAKSTEERGVREDEHGGHALDRIQDALRGLRFGEVTVIVQDGVVVQVERTEKLRLLRRRE